MLLAGHDIIDPVGDLYQGLFRVRDILVGPKYAGAAGVVLNLLGPSTTANDKNILMDVDDKYPGITHVSYRVSSIDEAKRFLAESGIPLTGEFSFKGMHAIFIRDPDRNVIELDAYAGDEPETRKSSAKEFENYKTHP